MTLYFILDQEMTGDNDRVPHTEVNVEIEVAGSRTHSPDDGVI